jgi:hypothetical protein
MVSEKLCNYANIDDWREHWMSANQGKGSIDRSFGPSQEGHNP